MIVCSRAELDELAEFVLRDYLKDKYTELAPVDIRDFAGNYLKMNVSYKHIFDEHGTIGIRSGRNIYLDESLLPDNMTGRRNFTLAHECAHELMNCQEDVYTEYDYRYSGEKLRPLLITEEDWREWQANALGAALLMRPSLLGHAMFTFARKEKLTQYGEKYFSQEDRIIVENMRLFLGVSRASLLIRLKEQNMIESKPESEIYDTYLLPGRCVSCRIR